MKNQSQHATKDCMNTGQLIFTYCMKVSQSNSFVENSCRISALPHTFIYICMHVLTLFIVTICAE